MNLIQESFEDCIFKSPKSQSKLVELFMEGVLDVAVDLRKESPTYGKYESIVLSSENSKQLFIPKGFCSRFYCP